MSRRISDTSQSIAFVIAEHADMETMSILASSKTLKLCYDLNTEDITANRAVLKERQDYSEKLSEAFEEVISIVHLRRPKLAPLTVWKNLVFTGLRGLPFTLNWLMP